MAFCSNALASSRAFLRRFYDVLASVKSRNPTLLDFEVLLLTILTRAKLSILKRILVFESAEPHTNRAKTIGTNSRNVISLIMG
jgi:hypothetical protein